MNDYYTAYNLSVVADTDILDEPFVSVYTIEDRSYLNIYVTPVASGVLSYIRVNGENSSEEILNENNPLVVGCSYMFTIMISEDAINLRYSVDTTFTYIQIREVL